MKIKIALLAVLIVTAVSVTAFAAVKSAVDCCPDSSCCDGASACCK